MHLTDRVVLLTGARRIGAAVATAVSARGADVVLTYNRSRAEADEAAADGPRRRPARARRAGGRVGRRRVRDAHGGDRSRVRPARRARQHGVALSRRCRSTSSRRPTGIGSCRSISADRFWCRARRVPLMRRHGGGRIINFTDWVAASGRPRYKGYLAYYVAKAGVKALTEALALEAGGRSDSGQRDRARARSSRRPARPTRSHKPSRSATPLGRWGGPRRSSRPCWRSSTRTSSPARRSASTAADTCTDACS